MGARPWSIGTPTHAERSANGFVQCKLLIMDYYQHDYYYFNAVVPAPFFLFWKSIERSRDNFFSIELLSTRRYLLKNKISNCLIFKCKIQSLDAYS